jgi:phospho-N-acetylmuramoyl-pentapeptide-transferase
MDVLRAALPLILGLAFALALGLVLIPYLRRLRIGQHIRSDGPKSHQAKAGTPTIGGLIFILAAALAMGTYHAATSGAPTKVELLVMLFPALYGAVGFMDDYRKVRLGRSLGLKAREKMALQVLFAAVFMYVALGTGRGSEVIVPFTGARLDLDMFYGLFGVLVIVSAGNAINLTDGLDGLATGTVLIALAAYYYIARQASGLLNLEGLSPSILAWAGALLGFLAYNRHPARVFMGDTGSNALGALLSGIAILTRTELVLLFLAGIPVIETVSDILQVASFQLFGKRVFKMAPLHHHFELSGWKETRIVLVFWLAEAVFALVGIASMALAR